MGLSICIEGLKGLPRVMNTWITAEALVTVFTSLLTNTQPAPSVDYNGTTGCCSTLHTGQNRATGVIRSQHSPRQVPQGPC